MERWLPMVFEQLLGDAVNEVGFRAETIVQFRGEAPVCSDLTNDREAWIVPVRCGVEVGLKRLSLGNLPEAVRLQVPKRILGSSRARRAEVLQEPSDVLLYSSKRNQALITALERGQCVEQEQGLVRRPFATSSPNVDVGEMVEDLSVARFGVGAAHGTIMAVLGCFVRL